MPSDTSPPRHDHLILASRSPRRAAMLREAGLAFTVMTPPFDDPADPQLNNDRAMVNDPHHGASAVKRVERLAMDLALRKALSLVGHLSSFIEPRSCVLAADTIVLAEHEGQGVMLGQPATRELARDMLSRLINTAHHVTTGVALVAVDGSRDTTFADTATVELGQVGDDELNRYLDSGEWRGKAGGYNLMELEQRWPFKVTGDPTTVAGLPMRQLLDQLGAW